MAAPLYELYLSWFAVSRSRARRRGASLRRRRARRGVAAATRCDATRGRGRALFDGEVVGRLQALLLQHVGDLARQRDARDVDVHLGCDAAHGRLRRDEGRGAGDEGEELEHVGGGGEHGLWQRDRAAPSRQ